MATEWTEWEVVQALKKEKLAENTQVTFFFKLFWNLSDFSFTMDEWTSACMKRERTAEDKAAAETFTAVLSRGVWADPVS